MREVGLNKIQDGRFPAHSIPFILLVQVAILSRGRCKTNSQFSQLALLPLNETFHEGVEFHCARLASY